MGAGTIERAVAVSLLLAGLCLGVPPAFADRFKRIDPHPAQQLVEQGRIRPLVEILEQTQQRMQGRLIKTELEFEHGRWIYELEYLVDGEVWELYFDAASGELLKQERD